MRTVLITGSGRGFCAGQDLGDRNPDSEDWPPDLGHTLATYFNPLVRLITELPMPVICAVNGVAAGAGANLALACDVSSQLILLVLFRPSQKLDWFLMRVVVGSCQTELALRGPWV